MKTLTPAERTRVLRAMRQAARIGVDPRNSNPVQAALYRKPWATVREVKKTG